MRRFKQVLLIVLALFVVVAIFDNFQYPQSFWMYSVAIAGAISLMYLLFTNKKKEAIALMGVFLIMLAFGAEDLAFYLIGGNMPETMPHLNNHKVIGTVSRAFGYSDVTSHSLGISVGIGAILSLLFLYKLKMWRKIT